MTQNLTRKQMKAPPKEILKNLFLFNDMSDEALDKILPSLKLEIKDYAKGDGIYTPEDFDKKIGFILEGECVVERIKNDGCFPINKLIKYDSFGVIAIFSNEEKFPTQIRAKRPTRVLFLDSETVTKLIKKNPDIALNLIRFMSKKINFLNSKIATLSADTVEQKLSSYLINESSKLRSDAFEINMKRTSEAINIGRASLYRAIAEMSESGLIKLVDKKIYILDREGLERNSK